MNAVDWLPPVPLSVADCAEVGDAVDGVHRLTPILGLTPAPSETVIALFVDRRDGTAWLGYRPVERAWVELERGDPADQLVGLASVVDAVMAFVERQYPDQQVGLLKEAFGTG